MSQWRELYIYYDSEHKFISFFELLGGFKKVHSVEHIVNTNIDHMSPITNAYFGKNIFYNFNIDNKKIPYVIHKNNTEEETNRIKQKWCAEGLPDYILWDGNLSYADYRNSDIKEIKPVLSSVFGEDSVSSKYYLIKKFHHGFIWKNKRSDHHCNLYIRKDLYPDFVKKYGKITSY